MLKKYLISVNKEFSYLVRQNLIIYNLITLLISPLVQFEEIFFSSSAKIVFSLYVYKEFQY